MKVNKYQELLLLMIVFLAFIGISISIPIFTPLLLDNNANSIVSIASSHKLRSILLGVLIGAYPLGQFFGSPIIGRISDNYGRRSAMIYTLFGAGIGYLITAASLYYKNIFVLMLSRLFTGFLEGNIAVARSSMSDISNPAVKHKNFGKIAAAATTGSTLGPLIGGVLSDHNMLSIFNTYTPFYCAAILLFILSIICKLYFTETSKTSHRQKFTFFQVKQYNVLANINKLGNNSSLKYFLCIWLLVIFVIDGFVFFLPAFLVSKWHMTPVMIAIYVALLNIWYIFGSLLLVPYAAKYLKSTQAIIIGMVFYGLSLILMLIPQNSLYLIPIFILCDLAAAIIIVNGFVHISNLAKGPHQGEVMGLALGLRTLGGAIIGLIGGILISISNSLVIFLSIFFSILVIILLYLYNYFID